MLSRERPLPSPGQSLSLILRRSRLGKAKEPSFRQSLRLVRRMAWRRPRERKEKLRDSASSTYAQDGQVLWSRRGAKCSPGNSSHVLASLIGGLPGQLRPRGVAARRLLELRGLPSNLWSCLTLRPARLSKPNNANISSTGRISGSSKAEQSPKCAPTGPRPPEVCVREAGRTGSWAKIRTYICGSSIKSHLRKEVYVGHYYYRTYFPKLQCQRLA